MRNFVKMAAVVAVNVLVFAVLLGFVELYFRIWGHERLQSYQNGLWQTFQPYVMFTTAAGDYKTFTNEFKKENFPSSVKTNSLGFNDRREFSLTTPYRKAPNEKVVLFTGGSAAWGVGASATDRTIAARMEFYLNKSQSAYKYSVINLAMGSWIAFQQFIGLQLWGAQFDPDWLVVMDGFNDAGTGCGFSQGPGNPMYFATMRSYVHGYLLSTQNPVFYRGWLENELIRHSAAYRIIMNRKYVPNDQIFDETSSESNSTRRQIIPTKVGESREILAFYLDAERATLKLFPKARYILSTQPVVNQFTGDFPDIYRFPIGSAERNTAMEKRTTDLENYLRQYEDAPCGEKNAQPSFTYVFGNGAIMLEEIADAARAQGRDVEYHNIGTLFPDAREERSPYFIDPVHLSDQGNDIIGKFYADRILAARAEPPAPALPEAVPSEAIFSLKRLQQFTASTAPGIAWDTLDGLRVDVIDKNSHVAGQPTLHLSATDEAARHAIALRFGAFANDQIYRVTLWVKGPPSSRIMVEARDGVDPHTGHPAHYGLARFDLSTPALVSAQPDIQDAGIGVDVDDWRKVSVDVKSSDGFVYILVGLLEGGTDRHIFTGSSKFELTIGGIDVTPL